MTAPKLLPLLDRVNELLTYDPLSGEFRWKVRRGPNPIGKIAGSLHYSGYIQIMIDGRLYPAHRLAWLVHYGFEPPDEIDHISRIGSQNWITNLREANRTENMANRGTQRNNSSGHAGVRLSRATGKWVAAIQGQYLGSFDTLDEAVDVRQQAEIIRFGTFRRLQPVVPLAI